MLGPVDEASGRHTCAHVCATSQDKFALEMGNRTQAESGLHLPICALSWEGMSLPAWGLAQAFLACLFASPVGSRGHGGPRGDPAVWPPLPGVAHRLGHLGKDAPFSHLDPPCVPPPLHP